MRVIVGVVRELNQRFGGQLRHGLGVKLHPAPGREDGGRHVFPLQNLKDRAIKPIRLAVGGASIERERDLHVRVVDTTNDRRSASVRPGALRPDRRQQPRGRHRRLIKDGIRQRRHRDGRRQKRQADDRRGDRGTARDESATDPG